MTDDVGEELMDTQRKPPLDFWPHLRVDKGESFKQAASQFSKLLPVSFQTQVLAKQDYQSLSLLQKLAVLPHFITATLLILYYQTGTMPEPNDTADTAEEPTVPEPHSVSEHSEPGKTDDVARFLHAARVLNPFFVILPAIFVLYLTVLDKLAKYAMTTPFLSKLWNDTYRSIAEKFDDPRWIRDFTLDFRPLVFAWCMVVPLITITLMPIVAVKTFIEYVFPKKASVSGIEQRCGQPCIVLPQCLDRARRRGNFYSSGWFNPIVALPFLLGVPAAISLSIYNQMGVDALLAYPSQDPRFATVFIIIQLYLYGLGACLCTLFLRSYFSFYLNFDSQEYELEIYSDMIKRLPIKGVFSDFMTLSGRFMPMEIKWCDVNDIKFSSNRSKPNKVDVNNPLVAFLGKLITVYESLARKMEMNADVLLIYDKHGRRIDVRLWELSPQQKVELFQTLRLNCPSVPLDESVQVALVGSAVMRESQYTQIWFSVLTDKNEVNVDGDLNEHHELQSGKFKVTSKLASGGQAVIYAATDTSTGERVVLKEFRLTAGESLDARIESAKDFENESALLSQLEHDSIVKMQGMFYENGRVYITLDHVEGKSLRDIVTESGVMGEATILNLAEQMCRTLDYLHSFDPAVVHRDFTPDNLILQPDGTLKLIDFSIAQRKAKVSECAGKHAYTPPEQFGGKAVAQSDLYALGGTLYFLATGEDPEALTQLELSAEPSGKQGDANRCADDAEERANERRSLLRRVIKTCTALQLSDRYESARWILNDLGVQTDSESPEASDSGEKLEVTIATDGELISTSVYPGSACVEPAPELDRCSCENDFVAAVQTPASISEHEEDEMMERERVSS
ncbi:MAG: serine/threonine protein kinase [Candidatus Obscuribacterales bacterium]|nr:serine/threonine protein kinase [Candidatus Obscuribacterales bacterium]